MARPVVDPRRVDDFFNWLIKKENFKPRQEQRDFAHFCIGAMNQGGAYAIEAGTGTGKTLGYLIPACECIRQSQAVATKTAEDSEDVEVGKIIIATCTKNLQNRLLEEEWRRRLTQTGSLYQNFKAASLKGRNNFLCITAVADLFGEMCRSQEKQKPLEKISPDDQVRKRLAWLFLFLVLIRNRGITEGHFLEFFSRPVSRSGRFARRNEGGRGLYARPVPHGHSLHLPPAFAKSARGGYRGHESL